VPYLCALEVCSRRGAIKNPPTLDFTPLVPQNQTHACFYECASPRRESLGCTRDEFKVVRNFISAVFYVPFFSLLFPFPLFFALVPVPQSGSSNSDTGFGEALLALLAGENHICSHQTRPWAPNTQQVAQLSQRDRAAGGGSFGKKYKRENRASNIALTYSVDVDESPFYCFMSPYLYLMQNFAFSALSQCTRLTDRQTDGRTDRILIAIPRPHSMHDAAR